VRTTPLALFDPLDRTTSPPQQNVFARFFANRIQLPNYLPSLFHFVLPLTQAVSGLAPRALVVPIRRLPRRMLEGVIYS